MKVVYSEEQIRERVREIARDVTRDCEGEEIHVVGILENGFVFVADLVRQLTCPVVCHFMMMDSKDTVMGAQEIRSIAYGPIANFEGKNILLVDALVDSGITLDHLLQQMLLKKPKSVRVATLVDREDRRRTAFRVNYSGFNWDGGHLVGYGMAMDGLYRNLPYVAAITPAANVAQGKAKNGGAVTP